MADEIKYGTQPFEEAADFFRQKVSLPTKAWTDLWQGMHARAFVVAGATKDELLADLRASIAKAIEQGTGIREFRKDFDRIVGLHKWSYKGGRNWRTRVIYDTNLKTAYQAGRYKQMTTPHMLKRRPFWAYVHGDSQRPRPHHLAWDGTVLPADHPWWKTHYGPNGWGCSCTVDALSQRDLERMGKSGPDEVPSGTREVTLPDGKTKTVQLDGTYEWKNKATGLVEKVPNGIDPGWAYNVGEAATGMPLAAEAMAAWKAQGAAAWEPLTSGAVRLPGGLPRLPVDRDATKREKPAKTTEQLERRLRNTIGGDRAVFQYPQALGAVQVDAAALARHMDLSRSPWVATLPRVIEDPAEIWIAFERHRGTGRVVMRHRIIKVVYDGWGRALLLIAQAKEGMLEAWTFIPTTDLGYVERQRWGWLLYRR